MATTIASLVLSTGITSAVLQVLLDRIANFTQTKISQFTQLHVEFLKLGATMSKAKALVDDVENKKCFPEACRILLEDVKSVVLDADDLLDEIDMDLEKRNSTDFSKYQVSQMFLSSRRFNIPSELSKIHKELVGLVEKLESYCMINSGQPQMAAPVIPSTSLVDESSIIARGSDKEKIIQMVLSEQGEGGGNVSVIPIVGMGGIGKTALAQLVYNDSDVVKNFDFKIWVSVSLSYDVVKITKSIFNSLTEQVSGLSVLKGAFELSDLSKYFELSLNEIHIQLQKKLRGKKFLLVLDDMWNENPRDWDLLKLPFQVAAQGSKIVMTTRSEIASSILSGAPAYHLDTLSHNDCWTIIKQTAGLSDAHEKELIGLKIAKKCKGLPLAAKVIGSVLRYKSGVRKWDALLKCELWESPEHGNHIYPALKLSYDNLSSYLRRCFTYCSIFPRDHEFEKDDLVQLWAAEGFIQAQGREEIEDIGREYFGGLCSRSFFQVSDDGQPRYKMHDLIHDLARLVSANISFSMEDDISTILPIPRHARYSSLLCQDIKPSTLEVFHRYEKLRTFMLISEHASNLYQVPYDFFIKLGRLRVLNLSHSGISDLPDSIKNLIHLRYLNLSHTSIKRLPKSLADIYGLETLKLKNCCELLQLPANLKNLIKLRHLDFDGYRLISSMPIEVGKLTSLETLPAFIVGKHKGYQIGELKNMRFLRGSICITNLENVASSVEGEAAMLHEKQYLEKLELEWNEMGAQTVEQEVLTSLKPHVGLRELRVTGYCGLIFPNWIADSSFCKLERIDIDKCHFCTLLPSLGQLPALKYLLIQDMRALENVDLLLCGSAGSFPSLETLTFRDMPKLKIWSGINENDMPHLRVLSMDSCPEFVTLPSTHYLRSLEMLEINRCPELQSLPREGLPLSLTCLIISESDILKERCKVQGADWDKIKSVPNIMIDDEVIPMEGRQN
ncbi:putative disease resistance RPP13-like protein 1 [Rosa rugosa]|uniref:putative disease resistance RPP13-like protein 1 n=1 Tax=Rosa rugosa TaxID=74645 RepID=UPI002B4107E2|nr:putative disease resistance RPP13-like protein 1 [Rosa rugosa]XP_062027163.1 putative disease resistance RPP13-like protein 1 [Rosa rugosa]